MTGGVERSCSSGKGNSPSLLVVASLFIGVSSFDGLNETVGNIVASSSSSSS